MNFFYFGTLLFTNPFFIYYDWYIWATNYLSSINPKGHKIVAHNNSSNQKTKPQLSPRLHYLLWNMPTLQPRGLPPANRLNALTFSMDFNTFLCLHESFYFTKNHSRTKWLTIYLWQFIKNTKQLNWRCSIHRHQTNFFKGRNRTCDFMVTSHVRYQLRHF